MRRNLHGYGWILALFASLTAAAARSLAAPAPEASYRELRGARPDGRTLAVQALTIERDVYRFTFTQGTFHFLAPIAGRTVGAVFLGQGEYELKPATQGERNHLALRAGERDLTTLRDRFDRLVLLFADDTFEELGLAGTVSPGTPSPQAVRAYEDHLEDQRRRFRANFHLRLLEDLLNAPASRSGTFLAFVDGDKLPVALLAVDPRGADALKLGDLTTGEDTVLFVTGEINGGFWYVSHRAGELAAKRAPAGFKPLADAEHTVLDTRIRRNDELEGTATLRLRTLSAVRALPLRLLPTLRVREAALQEADGTWTQVEFVQEAEREDADLDLILPRVLPAGTTATVRLSYAGKEALKDGGEGNFYVGARESWYPNLGGFQDLATFDLTYRVPEKNEVISVGKLESRSSAGGEEVAHWVTPLPIRVAGFNYGRFRKLERQDDATGFRVEVDTNPGTPNIVREIKAMLSAIEMEASGGMPFDPDDPSGLSGMVAPTLSIGKLTTESLAESALVDGINAVRVGTSYFGKLPVGRVAITQQSQWFFGQSWPSLIYLPYISFMTGTMRNQLGLNPAKDFVDEVGFHEMAHQWWGHHVGWDSYRDVWLSEGFSQFTAALAVQHTRGWRAYREHWSNARKFILATPPGNAVANNDAGPIALGTRVATPKTPSAMNAIVYYKGAFVLHMLRMLLWDGTSRTPDANFIALMTDFAAENAGKNPSTLDFQRAVERHMTPAMNATGDGKMDWFFDQWVRGTAIPKFVHDLKVEKGENGWSVRGSLRQEGIGDAFRTLVPVYAEFEQGKTARFAAVPLLGTAPRQIDLTVNFPKKPRRIVLNVQHEVLARD